MLKVLVIALFVGIYVGGVWKFWTGFRATNFSNGRIILGLLWPILIFNGSYRNNFNRALKG